jgi:hypothetical protein
VPKAAIASTWNTQAVAAIATTVDANGHPYLPATFSDDDLELLEAAILARCDAYHGLADGILPRRGTGRCAAQDLCWRAQRARRGALRRLRLRRGGRRPEPAGKPTS